MLAQISGDAHDFRLVNDFARDTGWLHEAMKVMAAYGIVLFPIALIAAWWIARRRRSARDVALAVWGALGALLALAAVQPIASAADEQRPFVALPRVLLLVHHNADVGFPSDHATLAGAVAAAVLFVSWRLGLVTALAALLLAFSRVYVGVHYPQDVLAGLALGALIVGAGVVLVVPLLTRLVARVASSPLRPLVSSGARV